MTLGELLDRAYFILGDVRDNPKFFLRDRVVDLLNEGCRQFRRAVEDEWYRQDIPVVAGQHTYDLPDINVRIQRIAFDDYTMRPRTVQEIVGLDAKWETRTGPVPYDWTTQGVSHDQFRVYPTPSVSTSTGVSQTGEIGTVISWDTDGTPATFSSELGIITQIVGENPFDGEFGEVNVTAQTNTKQLTVWGVRKVDTMVGDESDIPLKKTWWRAPLYYALWQIYESEHEQHNSVLASVYRKRYKDEVDAAQNRVSSPLPFLVFKLGQRTSRTSSRAFLPFAPEAGDGLGGTQSIGWPKKGYWS